MQYFLDAGPMIRALSEEITMPFDGSVDYCVESSEIDNPSPCTFVQDRTLPHASCASQWAPWR